VSPAPFDEPLDQLIALSLQARPRHPVDPALAERIVARAGRGACDKLAAQARVRYAQQAATLVAAALLAAIAFIAGSQVAQSAWPPGLDAAALDAPLAESGETGAIAATTQVASFGLGLALAVVLLIGLHAAWTTSGAWQTQALQALRP
jgi:hypothetical protein